MGRGDHQTPPRHRDPQRGCLVGHVDHPDLARRIDVRKLAHESSLRACAPRRRVNELTCERGPLGQVHTPTRPHDHTPTRSHAHTFTRPHVHPPTRPCAPTFGIWFGIGFGGCFCNWSKRYLTAASSCGSCPLATRSGLRSTVMSGSMPWFSAMISSVTGSKIANEGAVTIPPST